MPALLVMLAVLAAVAVFGLVLLAHAVGSGRPLTFAAPLGALARPEGVMAWSVAITTLMIPVVVAAAVFPEFVSL